ncbi:MAG: heme lyase CcmF/NrfE family subunit [FCB group bacterium]|nr:heme lyase CcmF/NrfE family subunit [FCB group bacterium]
MPVVGSVALSLGLGFSILTILILAFYLRTNDYRLYLTGQRSALGVSVLAIIATLVLINELLRSNFNVDYVAHYTSLETPWLYKFSALWAGQAGSLLFWLCILAVYTIIVIFLYRNRHRQLMPWILIVLTSVQLFFYILINFITNPFEPTSANFVVANGNGLNPLLQNVTMALHPPTLYLGFVGFSIPFAFAIAALITKETNPLWIRSIRRWSLVTWLFLSIGIILGGWWAYQELGWGGYWAWDPVENASFMPWLTATAFIHSIMIQEKKNMLRVWNMVLIILTFALSVFGTFLTRSGVLSSVHSFAESPLGPMFIDFVILILVVSTALIIWRLPVLKSRKRLESFTSRESGFLFNNVVFIVICFAVFWGTIFPIISEAVRGTKITVGPPFFNQVNVPIGLLLLFLTGVGPLLAWRRTSKQGFIKNFTIPIVAALIGLIIFFYLGFTGYVLVSMTLIVFVLVAILLEFYRGINARRRRFGENPAQALWRMIRKNRSRYGGYIVHLGIVFMFVGFVGAAFNQEKEFSLKPGESEHVGEYNFQLKNLREEERLNHYAWIADLRVSDTHGKFITNLHPEKRVYFFRNPDPDRRQPHSELDIYEGIIRDIYSVFTGIEVEKNTAYFKIMINPLVWWVWLGGYVLVFGALVSLWPSRRTI